MHYTLKTLSTGEKVIATDLKGKDLLSSGKLTKGCAFTQEERRELKILGRLPYAVEDMETQVRRHYEQYKRCGTDLQKNIYLNTLFEKNERLFYRLAQEHVEEMLPIIYTPTIGEAVEQFSLELRATRGLYLAAPDIDLALEILANRAHPEIDLIVCTDGEGVLGIGDQGVGGMDICIGKLQVYTLCGAINPLRTLPIALDVGTNNEQLLYDPMYLGWRHKRLSGKEYDSFIARFVAAVQKTLPGVYLHWEDFGRENARRNLDTYRDQICSFNDDIQGTGATALACLLSGLTATGSKLSDQRIVLFGAGTAGMGIADQIALAMTAEGISLDEARSKIVPLDRPGILTTDMKDLTPAQKPYARPPSEKGDLLSAVNRYKPTVLIGCSAVRGAFNEEVVRQMAKGCPQPIILSLSNPTSRSEADPRDLLEWTNGKALIATGSPYPPVKVNGRQVHIAQSNNAYIFPGLGAGVIASKATKVTDKMIAAACRALSEASPCRKDPRLPLLPPLDQTPAVSKTIALAVALTAVEEGVAGHTTDLERQIAANSWKPEYLRTVAS
ncbi:MAG: NAD-dependent malic enzyme [Parachlamydiales bacterium]